jgi:hypothetical protein
LVIFVCWFKKTTKHRTNTCVVKRANWRDIVM